LNLSGSEKQEIESSED